MSLRQHLCSALVLGGILVASSESRGDPKPALTADQLEAKTTFEEDTKDALANLRAKCPNVTVQTPDFENFDKKKWTDQQRRKGAKPEVGVACATLIAEVTRRCSPSSSDGDRDAPKRKPSKGSSDPAPAVKDRTVTSVACLFAGAHDAELGDDADDQVLRNMSFSGGAFTIRLHPRLANVQWNASTLISTGGAEPTTDKRNGLSCSKHGECKSRLCASGTCKACSETSCGPGRTCSSNKCWTDSAGSSSDESSSPPARPTKASDPDKGKKGLGQSCKSSSECASRYTCKPVSKSRSTCR